MEEPTEEEIRQREERGFADALLFVATEAERRWPTVEDAVEIHVPTR